MSPFTVLVLCIQACLIQSVMSTCGNGNGYRGVSSPKVSYSSAPSTVSSTNYGSCGKYGGEGQGTVNAAGDICVSGKTDVVGSVPVLGCVSFSGCTQACGSTSIAGQCCGCGCRQ